MVNKIDIQDMKVDSGAGYNEEVNMIDQSKMALVDNKLVNKAFKINFEAQTCLAICDSGSDISVLKNGMLPVTDDADEGERSTVKLQGAFDTGIVAQLRNVSACLVSDDEDERRGETIVLTCAITDELRSK